MLVLATFVDGFVDGRWRGSVLLHATVDRCTVELVGRHLCLRGQLPALAGVWCSAGGWRCWGSWDGGPRLLVVVLLLLSLMMMMTMVKLGGVGRRI